MKKKKIPKKTEEEPEVIEIKNGLFILCFD
jgi:hypothetical protein